MRNKCARRHHLTNLEKEKRYKIRLTSFQFTVIIVCFLSFFLLAWFIAQPNILLWKRILGASISVCTISFAMFMAIYYTRKIEKLIR